MDIDEALTLSKRFSDPTESYFVNDNPATACFVMACLAENYETSINVLKGYSERLEELTKEVNILRDRHGKQN